jgi:hypothetical protein
LTPGPSFQSRDQIVSGGKFILNNSSTAFRATVYAKDEISVNAEDASIEGSLSTPRKNTLNGNGIEFRYKPVCPELAKLVFGVP